MMDKLKRLKLYSEKDYNETIDFPVELVGRDGVVRRYSYADSIRIYERRIESAHVRYTDQEIINAEINHCSRRLEQIKRSWRQRIRSSERQFVEGRQGSRDRELYEQGKRFLMQYIEQYLGEEVLGPVSPNLVNLEEQEDHQIFYVNWTLFHPGTLLYVYRITEDEADVGLAGYRAFVQLLQTSELAPDTEKLVQHAVHDGFAWVLTCPRADPVVRGGEGGRLVAVLVRQGPAGEDLGDGWVSSGARDEGQLEPMPYFEAVEALHHQDLDGAFQAFRAALDENPYHRDAYWALASLSDVLGRWDEGEAYALMALRYFPDEARAHFSLGLAFFRRRALGEAQQAFERALRLGLHYPRSYGFLACVLIERRRYSEALAALEAGLKVYPRDQELLKLAIPLQRARRWQAQSLTLLGFLMVALVGLGLWLGSIWVVLLSLTLVGLGVWMRARMHRGLRRKMLEWSRPVALAFEG